MVKVNQSKGFSLIELAIVVAVLGVMMTHVIAWIADYHQDQLIAQQAKKTADIVNAVVRYQASAEDPDSGLLSPLEQWDQAGEVFEDGATHKGLDWLKEASCGSGASAPFFLLDCFYLDVPPLGDNSEYSFTVENDGVTVITTMQIVDAIDNTQGILIEGLVDIAISNKLAVEAESRVSFDGNASTSTFFTVTTNGIVEIRIGLDVANTPYLRRDGKVTVTGTQEYENGAGIKGASNISAEKFSAYDGATDTESTTHFMVLDGESNIEDLTADEINARNIEVTNTLITNAEIENLDVESFNQTDPSLSNNFAGELTVGQSDDIILSNGEIRLTGQVVDSADTDYFLDLDNTSRIEDIALASRGNNKLSNLLPNFVLKGVQLVVANDLIAKPDCNSTTASPRLILSPKTWTTYFLDEGVARINNNNNYFYADSTTTTWSIKMKTFRVSDQALIDDPQGSALANIYCYYP